MHGVNIQSATIRFYSLIHHVRCPVVFAGRLLQYFGAGIRYVIGIKLIRNEIEQGLVK